MRSGISQTPCPGPFWCRSATGCEWHRFVETRAIYRFVETRARFCHRFVESHECERSTCERGTGKTAHVREESCSDRSDRQAKWPQAPPSLSGRPALSVSGELSMRMCIYSARQLARHSAQRQDSTQARQRGANEYSAQRQDSARAARQRAFRMSIYWMRMLHVRTRSIWQDSTRKVPGTQTSIQQAVVLALFKSRCSCGSSVVSAKAKELLAACCCCCCCCSSSELRTSSS